MCQMGRAEMAWGLIYVIYMEIEVEIICNGNVRDV